MKKNPESLNTQIFYPHVLLQIKSPSSALHKLVLRSQINLRSFGTVELKDATVVTVNKALFRAKIPKAKLSLVDYFSNKN